MATIADMERRLAQIERELPRWRVRLPHIADRWEVERDGLLEQLAPFKHITDPGDLVLLDHAMEAGFRVRMTHGDPPHTSGVRPFVLVGTRDRPGGWRWPRPSYWSRRSDLTFEGETDFSKPSVPWRIRRERTVWD